jgi:hypothetical protein
MGLMISTLLVALVVIYTAKEKLHARIESLLIDQFKSNMAVSQAVDSLTDSLKIRTELEDRRAR